MPSENSPDNDLTSADILARLQQESAERQRLAAALEESERRYRTLVSEVRDYAIYAMDTHGRALTWNEGVQSVLGYQEAEFLGSAVELPFLPQDIAAGVPTRELETARREGVASDDRWLRKKDGTRFYAVGRTTRKLDGAGRLIGFTKVFRDETQRVLAEEKRRTEEARFRTLVQNLRDYAIFMLNAAGNITEWTEGAELVKGYKAQEVLDKHLEVFYTAEDREAKVPHRELEQAAQQGRAEREGWRITRSGERIWVNEIATAIYDSAGTLTGYTKISRNLTEKKRGG
jgi:PAS domain S-box-containing protein